MPNIKILIIAYYWPPSGGSSVQRCLKWAQNLPDYGIEPIILTVDEKYATYPFIDNSLSNEVPADLKVFKTKTKEVFQFYKKTIGKGKVPAAGFSNESQPGFLQKLSRFIRGNVFIPDPRKGWNKYAIPKAIEIMRAEKIDIVLTSSPPHSTQLIGLELKRQFNAKWIADFADAWTDIYWYKELRHLPFARKQDAKYEKNVLEKADHLITISDLLKDQFLKKSNDNIQQKFTVIHNGYNEKDFEKSTNPSRDKFTIGYIGTIGDVYKPEIFFRAIAKLLEQKKELPMVIRFAGIVSEGIMAEIEKYNLTPYCEFLNYVPHHRAVEEMLKSSALLLVIPVFENEKGNLPGKLYEYLASKRPIINIGPTDGESAKIIEQCEAGKTFNRGMFNELSDYLQSLSDRWKNNEETALMENENYKKYSSKFETGMLADIIKKISLNA
jgi:glycosyltransferase involved in cell wall biosynthesis